MTSWFDTYRDAVHALAGVALLVLALAPVAATGLAEEEAPTRLLLATTTSTENSGLLAELLPPFEERYNAVVDVVAVGTGQALEIGRSGDADVLMVHAPALERQFVEEGYGVERVYFMYNDFVVLGPSGDPADAETADDVADAFARIADAEEEFISRGDNSGTNVKELSLWERAGVAADDRSGAWYREVGQGMGAVITLANEQEAYTLADRGTYLAYSGEIDIEIVFEGDENLFNPYGIIAVNPGRHPHVNADLAQELVDYVVSEEGQAIIDGYQVNGQQLFFSDTE